MARITAFTVEAGTHELAVIAQLCRRLEKGRKEYGGLDIDRVRNWRQDLREELLDALVYDAILLLRGDK